jgi:hypothetical protein
MQHVQLSREEHTGMHWEERPNKMCVCGRERGRVTASICEEESKGMCVGGQSPI